MTRQQTAWLLRRGGLLLAAGLLPVLAGCTGMEQSKFARQAKTELVGMSREEVLDCAGPPERVIKSGKRELLVYFAGDESPAARNLAPTGLDAPGIFHGGHEANCEVTFVLEEGRVSELRYQGQTGGIFTRNSRCAAILRYCMR
jgi:hypothetical protein